MDSFDRTARQGDEVCDCMIMISRRFRSFSVAAFFFVAAFSTSLQETQAEESASLGKTDVTGGRSVSIDHEADPARLISAYNLFKDPRHQTPNDGVVPYDLNTPHFADYATLHRFLWIPKGSSCEYQPNGDLEYPIGATIILTVGYPGDFRDPDLAEHILETRLWIRKKVGWIGTQYIWNDDTSEAMLSFTGKNVDVSWIHSDGTDRHHTFRMPNRNQCLQCHEINDHVVPLGPVHARYLNKSYSYSHGSENQLEHWAKIGYLTGLPENKDERPRVAIWDDPATGDLNARARAYLDMNCSSCHRPGGIAFTSGLDLTFDQSEPVRFGIFKAPVAAGRGSGNGRFVIEPGHPEKSIMMVRLQSTDPGMRMPVVGRGLMHAEGVELIREWISQMDYADMAKNQDEIDHRASAGLEAFRKMKGEINSDAATKEN